MSIIARIIFITIFWGVILLLHVFIYSIIARVYDFWLPNWYIFALCLSFLFILANILNRMFNGKVVSVLYFLAASYLGIVFLYFSGIAFYEILGLLFSGDSVNLLNTILFLTTIAWNYALIQGRNLVIREYEIPVSGLKKEVKIVHLSDVHVGTVHQEKFLKRVVQKSNALKADMVLMTGDLFDGSEPIHEEMLRPLNKLEVPTYFSMGNHEEYEGLKHVRETISHLDMKLLDSEVVEQSGLQIIGVNDRQSIPKDVTLDSILKKLSYDKEKPTVLMYHTPVEWESARKHGVDLMLSGHTHNGQIYPFNLLVRIQFKYINGLYAEGGKNLHVSPGTGTWGPPMRLGSKNQITLITLVPLKV